MSKTALRVRTLVLSDVHLGAEGCQIEEVNHVLKHTDCDKLILNGDIVDSWSLKRRGRWTREHSRFVRLIFKKIEKKRTTVIYLRGNHDDVLARFLPLRLDRLILAERHVHVGPEGRYLVVHGDVLDVVTRGHRFLAVAGAIGYEKLLVLNRLYNRYRGWRGKPYFSLSKAIKARVKGAVNFVGKYEEELVRLARKHRCDGIICGHIHTPADKRIGEIHYLNSGDWVESHTLLVEHLDGRWEVLTYGQFLARLDVLSAGREDLRVDRPPVSRLALSST